MIRSSHEEPVREIAQGMLLDTQFQYFIPEVDAESSPATTDVHVSSPPYDVHFEKMDLSYPDDAVRTSAHPSKYQSPLLPERHTNTSYYRRRRNQLDKVDEGEYR